MNKFFKGLLVLGGVLAVVVLAAAGGGYAASEKVIRAKLSIPAERIAIPTDSLSIERGKHFAIAVGKCVDCHGDDLGGAVIVDSPPMGRFAGANLTRGRGGIGAQLKDEDYVRAIRHGVARDGHKIVIMPSEAYNHLSPEDLGAIIAYVKQVPPVEREFIAPTFGPVARGLIATGKAPLFMADHIDHSKPAVAAPMAGPTAEYGKYLANAGGCTGCHGPTLSGGKIAQGDPSWPPAANLTPTGLKGYTEETFMKALRTGIRPSGVAINPVMPWKRAGEMTDDEIRAVWAYLQTVPPKEFGNH
ncbi:MAG: c-type cytochrome [Gemmatimonadetes bacterium]|nr:c-type cytochrome [Gemmatimonadota bacterium]